MHPKQHYLGLYLAGRKALAFRKTTQEIESYADRHGLSVNVNLLQYAGRMFAKVDNSAVQDGFNIYQNIPMPREKNTGIITWPFF